MSTARPSEQRARRPEPRRSDPPLHTTAAQPGTTRLRRGARLAFGAVVLLATLSPWRFDADAAQVAENLEHALRPAFTGRDLVDGLRNLALFAGWGVVWLVTAPAGKGWRTVLAATLSGLALSVSVEVLQLFSPTRTASVLDVLTNSTGSLGGALLSLLLIAGVRRQREARSFVGMPAFLFAAGYGGAVMLEALVPLFRHEMLPGARGGPLERLELALTHLRLGNTGSFPELDVVLFLPAGAFAVAALVELGWRYRGAAAAVLAAGLPLLAVVEVARGLTGQPIQPGALLAHLLGITLGAGAAVLWLPGLTQRLRGETRPLALLGGYALVLAIWSWRPFLPELEPAAILAELGPDRLVPLQAHAERVDLFSVADIGVLFLLYLPLGGLLAVWPLRTRGAWAHLLPALYLAAILEAGQILIAERFFDITDILVQSAGAAVGWVVVRRAGFRPYGEVLAARLPWGPQAAGRT